jgi:hypothetical protein
MDVIPMERRIPHSRCRRPIAWRKEQSETASVCVHPDLEFGDAADASSLSTCSSGDTLVPRE